MDYNDVDPADSMLVMLRHMDGTSNDMEDVVVANTRLTRWIMGIYPSCYLSAANSFSAERVHSDVLLLFVMYIIEQKRTTLMERTVVHDLVLYLCIGEDSGPEAICLLRYLFMRNISAMVDIPGMYRVMGLDGRLKLFNAQTVLTMAFMNEYATARNQLAALLDKNKKTAVQTQFAPLLKIKVHPAVDLGTVRHMNLSAVDDMQFKLLGLMPYECAAVLHDADRRQLYLDATVARLTKVA